jgi:DNA polymerase III delta subunit
MSLTALDEILEYAADHGHSDARSAAEQLARVRKAARGLCQSSAKRWNQKAWHEALEIMREIAEEERDET